MRSGTDPGGIHVLAGKAKMGPWREISDLPSHSSPLPQPHQKLSSASVGVFGRGARTHVGEDEEGGAGVDHGGAPLDHGGVPRQPHLVQVDLRRERRQGTGGVGGINVSVLYPRFYNIGEGERVDSEQHPPPLLAK